nr:NAD-dependent epimerase/dehydratase family protein [uncultured Mucilaginibacter sp.]
MNFLVTGAAGFIGSKLAAKLLALGNEVSTIDNLSTGIRDNIPDGVKFLEGDCHDEAVVNQLANSKLDAIFHLAGQSSGEISFDDPVYDQKANTQSTLLLMDLAIKTGAKKFLYASSMGVYGDQEDKAIHEDVLAKPRSFYGVGKLASEYYMKVYEHYDLNTVALRLFNVYGPGQNMANMRQGMVSIFLSQAINNGSIYVKGSKDRFRDIIYIDDVVNAFISAYESPVKGFNYFNVCTKKKTTVEQLVQAIQGLFNTSVPVTYAGSTPGDQFGVYGDNSKIIAELEWAPKTSLNEGIKEMYDWAILSK